MTLKGCKYSLTSHTAQSNISLNSGPSKDCSRRVSPALIAPSSEPEDDLLTSRNMTSIADSLVKVDASTATSNSEALLNVASDEDDDDDDASDDSGDDPKKKGKKSSSSKSRRELPAGAVATLKQWLLSPEHFTHPYPTPQDQTMLMQKTGIDKKQLKNWFTNARRRIWKPMLKKQLEEGKLPDVVSNDTLNNSSTSVLPSQEVKTVPIASSVSIPGEDQSQQQQYIWQGQQQNYGDALPQGNTQLSSFTYMSQYTPSQLNDPQHQISSMNPSNSIGSLPQISSFGSAGQMLKTDSHAVLMELFARDHDLVRQATKGARLKAQAATKNPVQANGSSLMLGGGNGSLLQSTKMSQAASVPSMNSWPHFSSVSSLNNLGSLAGVKSIHNLSGADLASQANKKGSLPHIKSQENMGRADSYAFLEVFFDNNAMSGRGTKREREEDNDVGLSLDADESPVCHSKPMDVVSSMTRPAPLPLGDIDDNDELKRNYDDALAARGLLSVSRSSEKLTDLPMQMQRTLSQEFLRHQFGGASLPSFCSFASWGQSQQSQWDAPQVTRHPGEDLVLKDASSSQEPNLYQPYQVLAPQAAASTPLSDPSMANASVEVPASTRCALCHQVNVDTQLRPCGHMFHGRCLKPSLQNAMGPPTCPIDNTPMQSAVLAVPADVRLDHLRGEINDENMGKEHLGKDDIREELQTYIKEKNLTSLLTSILESLLIDKPDNPVGHIVRQLTKLYPEETKQCIAKPNNRIEDTPRHVSQVCSDDESETTDHTGSTVGDLPGAKIVTVKGQNGRRGTYPLLNRRRSSISAEKTNFSLLRNSELKVNIKTKEVALRIQNMLSKTQSVLFKGLNQDQIIAIQNAMFLIEKNEGDVIIKQGDEGDNFYIIDQGSVNAFVKSTISMEPPGVLVKQYSEGGSFGELAIMYNAPRAATCIAASPVVRLWALDRASFKLILVTNTLSKLRENTGFLKQVAIFSQLTDHELLTVADSLEERDFSENEVVCLEGEAGDTFYIIKEGTAVCTKKDSFGNLKEVARLSRGSYFGEIALMTSKTRQATVTSLGHLKCLKLERKTFQRVMGPLVNFLMRNMDEYVKIQAANI